MSPHSLSLRMSINRNEWPMIYDSHESLKLFLTNISEIKINTNSKDNSSLI